MALDQVVGVIAVRNSLMAASRPVNMACLVPAARMTVAALDRVLLGRRDRMFFHGPVLDLMMKVSVVQVIYMPIMFHGHVTALFSMRVVMVGMNVR